MPTLQWEEIVRAQVSCPGKPAYEVEQQIKKMTADILKNAMSYAQLDDEKINAFISASGKHIVSLNFDTLLFSKDSNVNVLTVPHGKKPFACYSEMHNKTIWFPHGCVSHPDSIRLGLRDYGFLPSFWNGYFCRFKGVQRSFADDNLSPMGATTHQRLVEYVQSDATEIHHRFIGNRLDPLRFFAQHAPSD